jgi:hypothetical protein
LEVPESEVWEVWKVLFQNTTSGGLESGVSGPHFWRCLKSEVSGNSRFGSSPVRTAKPPSGWGYGLGVLEGGLAVLPNHAFGGLAGHMVWRTEVRVRSR